jgi:hypothetical protein
MSSLTTQLVHKLLKLEAEVAAQDLDQFWLLHNKYLRDDTAEQVKLEFLHPERVFQNETPITYNECEACSDDGVFYDPTLDQYTCHSCGFCQEKSRSPLLRYIPESSVYKHSVHFHQILHEMQCLRESLPNNIINDIKDGLDPPYTYDRIKKSLRRLGYQQHYSMVYTLQQILDPTFKPLHLTPKQEETMQGLFFQYVALGPIGGRKNRLNYHFVIGKIAKMCGYYDFIAPYLHPPKGKKAIDTSEDIWTQVCAKLKW